MTTVNNKSSARSLFHHEKIYRGSLDRIAQTHITVCGAGALGSNLVDNLARQGFAKIKVIDFDRVEQHNINTQIYNKSHVGMLKVAALKTLVFQAVGVEIETENKELIGMNAKKLLKGTDLVVDVFDNSKSRQLVTSYCQDNTLSCSATLPCLHGGLSGDGFGEVVWNENYRVPQDTGEVPPCDIALARNLVMLTVVALTEEIIRFTNKEAKRKIFITLNDLSIRKESAR